MSNKSSGSIVNRVAIHLLKLPYISNLGISEEFVSNLLALFMSMFISTVFLMVANLLLARGIGPMEYGKYALVVSLGNLLTVPMVFGLSTATVRYLAPSKDVRRVIGTSLAMSSAFIVAVTIVAVMFSRFWAQLIHEDVVVFRWAIVFAVVYSLFSIFKALLQGLHKLKRYALLEGIMGVVVFGGVIGLLYGLDQRVFVSAVLAVVGGWVFVSVAALASITREIGFSFDIAIGRKLLHYGSLSLVGGMVGFALSYSDRLFINHYLGATATGIYAAYIGAANSIASPMVTSFINGFFPTLSRIENKRYAIRTMVAREMKIYPLIYLVMFLCIAAVIKIIGKSYPFNWWYIALFSLYAVMFVASSIRWWTINSIGIKGARYTGWQGIIASGILVAFNVILVPSVGMLGSTIAGIAAFTYMLIAAKKYFGVYLASEKNLDE